MEHYCFLLMAIFCSALTPSSSESSPLEVGQADFALNLLRKSGDSSMILSPFSIATALSMTYAGAKNSTYEQMNDVLAKGVSDAEYHEHFGKILKRLSEPNSGFELRAANKVFVNETVTLLQDFLDIINSKYQGQIENVDFSKSAAVSQEINEWVENMTNSRIKDLVNPSMFNTDSVMFLVNAVYFKGAWADQFPKGRTKKAPFYEAEDKQREVDMMSNKEDYGYTSNEKMQVLRMQYRSSPVDMYVFLPTEKFGLSAMEDSLTGKDMLDLIENCWGTEVIVNFPKFKLEQKLELVNALKEMGIIDAFGGSADFSGMSSSPTFISDVVHKAFIEVNEEGTEAAAATGIQIMLMSAPIMLAEPVQFTADHPFMFAITEGKTILFIGRVR